MPEKIKSNAGYYAILLLFIAVIALMSCYACFLSSEIETTLSMWALGVCATFTFLSNIREYLAEKSMGKIAGFFLVLCGFIAGYFQLLHLSLFILSLACVLFYCGLKTMLICAFPFAVWILAVPNYSYVHMAVSYPMRILETIISDSILTMLGYDVSLQGTSIFVNGKQIVITTACSGVEHLWTLLVLAWFSTIVMFKKFFMRAIYFLCIIPIFIFCNALRVVISVVGMKFWGDKILEGNAHLGLGMFAIIATMILFVVVGLLLQKLDEGDGDVA